MDYHTDKMSFEACDLQMNNYGFIYLHEHDKIKATTREQAILMFLQSQQNHS